MPHAGRHRPDAALVHLARRRAGAGRLRRRRAGPQARSRRASPRLPRPRPASRVLVSVFLVRRRRLAERARAHRRTRATRSCGPRWRCAARAGTRVRRGPEPALASVGGRRWPRCTARARSRSSRRSATPDAEPVALHEPPLLGGRRDQPVRPLGLARPLPRPARRRRQPAPGLTLGWDLQPSLAAQQVPVATVAARRATTSGAGGVGPGGRGDARRLRRARRARHHRPRPRATRAQAVAATSRLREQLAAVPERLLDARRRDLPGGSTLAGRLAGAGGDDRRRPAAARGGARGRRRLRHARRPGRRPARDLRPRSASLLAFQRDLEARGLADRVLVHVWSEFGRRPEENGSGTDHGAAGAGLRDRRARLGRDGRRVPRPRRCSTAATTCARPRTSAASTARCSSSGSAWTPRRSSRRVGVRARPLVAS